MEEQILLLKTLADPTRLKILKLIQREELCVCDLQAMLQISQPAVSQHMARLKAVGLVTERRAGNWTFYQCDLSRMMGALGALLTFLAADIGEIPAMADLAERRLLLVRSGACGIEEGEVET